MESLDADGSKFSFKVNPVNVEDQAKTLGGNTPRGFLMGSARMSHNQKHVLQSMNQFIKDRVKSQENTIHSDDEGDKPKKSKDESSTQKLDSRSLGAIINFKTSLQKNIPGVMINGNKLNAPNEPFSCKRTTNSTLKSLKPDQEELHLAYMSFKPGMEADQRYDLQDQTTFYSTQYN